MLETTKMTQYLSWANENGKLDNNIDTIEKEFE